MKCRGRGPAGRGRGRGSKGDSSDLLCVWEKDWGFWGGGGFTLALGDKLELRNKQVRGGGREGRVKGG